jgi:WD40 repeat protein
MYGAFSPDGTRLLTGVDGHRPCAQIWDLDTGKSLWILKGHIEPIIAVTWSKDQNLVASGSHDGVVRVWDANSGLCLRIFEHQTYVRSVEFSPDNMSLLVGLGDGTIWLWELKDGLRLRKLTGHSDGVYHAVFHSSRLRVLSGSRDGTIRLWDLKSGKCLRVFGKEVSHIQCIAWHPTTPNFLSSSTKIQMWNSVTGECQKVWRGHDATTRAVAWSPSSRSVLSASHDRTVRIWNVETFTEVFILKGHAESVVAATWVNESMLCSCDSSGFVCFWNL